MYKRQVEGIADGVIPEILDRSIIDEFILISDTQAIRTARDIIRREGIFAGISSGINVAAAVEIGKRMPGTNIVTIIPDSGQRYFTTDLFRSL